MPITVPRGPAPASREGPSDTDLLMAMATMERLGRLPTFDERFRGGPENLPLSYPGESFHSAWPDQGGTLEGGRNIRISIPKVTRKQREELGIKPTDMQPIVEQLTALRGQGSR